MAWIGKSQGVFRLHDSDAHCGSYLSLDDAAEILEVPTNSLESLPRRTIDGEAFVSELDLHKAWGSGRILSPQKPREANATRSLDELILLRLLQITLPGCQVDCQVPFGRRRVDFRIFTDGLQLLIEFMGPSHFIPQYQRQPRSPFQRKQEVEDHFGRECAIWPYWIQRCSSNIHALLDPATEGLASVWSTRAFFGNFVVPDAADTIVQITARFNAIRETGIGYMYGNQHTSKPIHPIIEAIQLGRESKQKLIPRDSIQPERFWLPEEIW